MSDHNYEPGDLVWTLGGRFDIEFACAEVVKATAKQIRIKNGTGSLKWSSLVRRDRVFPTKELAARAGVERLDFRIRSVEDRLGRLLDARAEAIRAMGGDA